MRGLLLTSVLPLLLFAPSAEAARISFATQDCGTPPLLGLAFTIDASGQSVLLNTADACPGELGIPGDLVGDNGDPFYGTSITTLDLTFSTDQALAEADFGAGDFFGENSLGFSFGFAPFTSGGGVLSITFDEAIVIPCTFRETVSIGCRNLDLLIFIDGEDDVPIEPGAMVRVTAVNGVAVPEPSTLALLGMGGAAAAIRRRRVTSKR